MATVQQAPERSGQPRPADRDPQVYHPLDRLRGIIRRYVLIEGLLSLALFVAIWFAAGLLLDFVPFKLFGWDWVRDGAWSLRLAALVIAILVFVAILAFRIVRRLTKELSYPALALVLERRFPKLLGDRLITAVEMADVEAMGRFGYSTDMIRATIAEARERVGKAAVHEAFNWRRLWIMAAVTLGIFLTTVLAGYVSYMIATKSANPYRYGWRFAHVSGIFLERNVALWDTPWPRRTHLEFVDFPESGEITVGRGEKSVAEFHVRAYKWVIADRSKPDGWRPMLWSDVNENLIGRSVPSFSFAGLRPKGGTPDTGRYPEDASQWTVDAVERVVNMPSEGEEDPARVTAREILAALDAAADKPSNGRTVRKLELTEWVVDRDAKGEPVTNAEGNTVYVERPIEVKYFYAGKKGAKGSAPLQPGPNNEFTGKITGLKEDVEFYITAGDYKTPTKKIRLVGAPALKKLASEQDEPAYLHHLPPAGEGYPALRGLRQRMPEVRLALVGDVSNHIVPAGTELTIVGELGDEDGDTLKSLSVIPATERVPGAVLDDLGKPTKTPIAVPTGSDRKPFGLGADGKSFRLAFQGENRITGKVEFTLVMVNRYNIESRRTVSIQVLEDAPPSVEVRVEVIRKAKDGDVYLVTADARIPFDPASFIKDDRGLSKAEYLFTYWAETSAVERGFRSAYAARSYLGIPLPGTGPAIAMPLFHGHNFRIYDKPTETLTSSALIGAFVGEQQYSPIKMDDLKLQLAQPLGASGRVPPAAVKLVQLNNPNRDYFDLKELVLSGHLKLETPLGGVRPVYRLDLDVQATDNNADLATGLQVRKNAETIKLRIISESDLLSEMNEDVRKLADTLNEAVVMLTAAKRKYDFVSTANGSGPATRETVDNVKVAGQDALGNVEKARDKVITVRDAYIRLTRECEVNRVNEATTNRFRKTRDDLTELLVKEALELEPTAEPPSFAKVFHWMKDVQGALVANPPQWAASLSISNAQISLNNLTARLGQIREEIGETVTKDALRKFLLTVKENQLLIRQALQDLERIDRDIKLRKDPQLGALGVQTFQKGETKKLTHTIQWRQYSKDELVVKVKASDASIGVPAELKLNFEQNDVRFSYDVKAGGKAGMFTITLTPEVGDPVEVIITVN